MLNKVILCSSLIFVFFIFTNPKVMAQSCTGSQRCCTTTGDSKICTRAGCIPGPITNCACSFGDANCNCVRGPCTDTAGPFDCNYYPPLGHCVFNMTFNYCAYMVSNTCSYNPPAGLPPAPPPGAIPAAHSNSTK